MRTATNMTGEPEIGSRGRCTATWLSRCTHHRQHCRHVWPLSGRTGTVCTSREMKVPKMKPGLTAILAASLALGAGAVPAFAQSETLTGAAAFGDWRID